MPELPILSQDQDYSTASNRIPDHWVGKETNVLVLNYTLACALACDFCCYGCHPKRREKMPFDLAASLIRQAADLKVFSSVGFTGGEPMLFADEILSLADLMREVGLTFTIATAAHWATSREEADRILSPLAERGLRRINLSHDPSHEKFVPLQNVIHAAKAAVDHGIATIITGVFFSPEKRLAQSMPELAGREDVLLLDKLVNKVGRASKEAITQERFQLRLELEDLACYRRRFHDLVVFWDGVTYPCCSTFNRSTPGIALGNANADELRTLWQRAEDSSLLRTIKRQGFARLYQIVAQFDPELAEELPDPRSVVGACHLCNSIFRKPELAERVHAVFRRYEECQALATFDTFVDILGSEKAEDVLSRWMEV